LYDTEKGRVVQTIKREDALHTHSIRDVKVDPNDPNTLFLALEKVESGGIYTLNVANRKLSNKSTFNIDNSIVDFCIDEDCRNASLAFNVSIGVAYKTRLYKFDVNKPVNIDPNIDKSFVMEADANAMIKPGVNSIAIYDNKFGILEAR
jgi:hypothetical protein